MKVLILGFYGVGKTTVLKDHPNAIDLTDVPKTGKYNEPTLDDFYQYWNDDRYEIVMGDPQWTRVFIESGIPFYIVIPKKGRWAEFQINFKRRHMYNQGGGDYTFMHTVMDCWAGWIWAYKHWIPNERIIELKPGQWMDYALQYISEVEMYK